MGFFCFHSSEATSCNFCNFEICKFQIRLDTPVKTPQKHKNTNKPQTSKTPSKLMHVHNLQLTMVSGSVESHDAVSTSRRVRFSPLQSTILLHQISPKTITDFLMGSTT